MEFKNLDDAAENAGHLNEATETEKDEKNEKTKDDMVVYRIKRNEASDLMEALSDYNFVGDYAISGDNEADIKFQISMYAYSKIADKPTWTEKYGFLFNKDLKEAQDFIEEVNAVKKHLSGVIFLEDKDNDTYAISFGSAHHIVRKYCDSDFGFEIAEKIGNKDSICSADMSNFMGAVARKLESYENNTSVKEDEYGTAYNYLKIKSTYPNFVGVIKCGQACGVRIEGYSYKDNLISLLTSFREIKAKTEKNLRLPKIFEVTNKKDCANYDAALLEDILSENSNESIVSEYSIVGIEIHMNNASGYTFNYNDNRNDIYRKKFFDNISINKQDIKEFVKSVKDEYEEKKLNDFNINFFKIIIHYESGKRYSWNMLNLLNYRITYDDNIVLLRNGKWHRFNDCFMENITNAIRAFEEKNPIDVCSENLKLDEPIVVNSKTRYNKDETEIIKKLIDGKPHLKMVHPKTVVLKDFGQVELCDIYDEIKNELIFVKRKKESEGLCYLITQALNSVRAVTMPLKAGYKEVIKKYKDDYAIGDIKRIKLIIVDEKPIHDLHSLKLFNFKLDFCKLVKECESAKMALSVQTIHHK